MNSKVQPSIFRAYDIRGIVDEEITSGVVNMIGKGAGTYLLRKFGGNKVVVAMDNRLSSEELKSAVIEGLLSTGMDVDDIGLSTSPMMYQAVYEGDYSGGLIISASHNPKEYNGIKIVGKKSIPIAAEEMYYLRDMVIGGDFQKGSGTLKRISTTESYIEKIVTTVDIKRKIRVVVDTGNAVPGKFAPEILRELGLEVIEVHCKLDGSFPNHLPNPEKEENLRDLKKAVLENGADIGIGIDGDGDRVGVIDENGDYLTADYSIIMLARDYLNRNPGKRVLIDPKVSMIVPKEIKVAGGIPYFYKTGHSLIKIKMREEGILLGGEFSGHLYVFENYYPFDDAIFAGAKLLEILSLNEKTISEHFIGLPKLASTHILELGCPDEHKFEVVATIIDIFMQDFDVNTIDGARIEFEGGWALIRASNTTPILTFRSEANSRTELIRQLEAVHSRLDKLDHLDLSALEDEIATLKSSDHQK